jgi:mono/diheme cytochrome c family protein
MTNEKLMATWRWVCVVALATMAGIWAPAVANAQDADAGKQIFQEKCTACHTVGGGPLVGPDLKGVTAKRPREWLEQWIAAPDAMLAKKDPIATELLSQWRNVPMPNQGLGASDVTAILAYLETAAAGEAASAPVQANPEIGKNLFTGVTRFLNGGPPCMACHSVSGIGALGGGQLGPDLTGSGERYGGAAGLNAFIAGSPTPIMKNVWSQRPLTTEERASVVAFLGQAGVIQRPASAIWQLAGLAALGLIVLLGIAGFTWQNRTRNGVWRPMVSEPTTGLGAFHRTIADERGQQRGAYQGGWFTGPYHPGWKARFSPSGDDGPRANIPRRRS